METSADIISELRELIVKAAPDPTQALKVRECGEDEALDSIIPFSSLILLGVVVAVEDRFAIRITYDSLTSACAGGTTLGKLAKMIQAMQSLNAVGMDGKAASV